MPSLGGGISRMSRDLMKIDCRNVRKTLEPWHKSHGNEWKLLGLKANRRLHLMGKKGKDADDNEIIVDFVRAERRVVTVLTNALEVAEDFFQADDDEYDEWELKNKPSKLLRIHTAQRAPEEADEWPAQAAQGQSLEPLNRRLEGYYDVYHFATSRRRKKAISLFLLHVGGIDLARNVIRCEIHDTSPDRPYFHFCGHIAPLNGFLYWELLPEQKDAMCYCCSYRPSGQKRINDTLFGIFLTTSGDNSRDYPVAAKAAIRFIGETASDAVKNSVIDLKVTDDDPENALKKGVGGYLEDFKKKKALRPEILQFITDDVLPNISNEISPRASPFAL